QLLEITQGLAYLHANDVVHGDIRGNNILIDDSWHARLADFGLANFANETLRTVSSVMHAGSTRWMAPELLSPEREGLERFARTKASDIYALGCTTLEIYTGNVPFSDVLDEGAVMLQVLHDLRPERPPEVSPDRWSLIKDCWGKNRAERKTAEQVLERMEDMDFGESMEANSDAG
ncbi:kinase-like protein, partial [Rickenella mellea]